MPTPDPSLMSHAVTVFKLASDPLRLTILTILRDGERCVSDLCTALGQSQPGVSHHLALLRVSGAVASTRRGKNNFYSLDAKGRAILVAFDAVTAA